MRNRTAEIRKSHLGTEMQVRFKSDDDGRILTCQIKAAVKRTYYAAEPVIL